MKILKIFGIVAGIHALALLLIFANPGCSSARSATAAPAPAIKTDPAATFASAAPTAGSQITPNMFVPVPVITGSAAELIPAPGTAPAAPALGGAFYSPTRPGTPAAAAVEAQPVGDVTPTTTYAVGKGDSLWSIAKKKHLGVKELAAANNMRVGAALRPGQKLLIPTKGGAPAPVAHAAAAAPVAAASRPAGDSAPKASGEMIKYTVKSGETLGSIARRYHVRLGDLATANNISDPQKIRPGRELLIPIGRAPGRKSGRGSSAPGKGAAPAASAPASSAESLAAVPAPGQDLDAGIKPASSSEVPVIRIEAAPAASSPVAPAKP